MSVTLTTNAWQALAALGVHEDQISVLLGYGVKAEVQVSQTVFCGPEGGVLWVWPVKAASLQKVIAGTAFKPIVESLSASVKKTVPKLIAQMKEMGYKSAPSPDLKAALEAEAQMKAQMKAPLAQMTTPTAKQSKQAVLEQLAKLAGQPETVTAVVQQSHADKVLEAVGSVPQTPTPKAFKKFADVAGEIVAKKSKLEKQVLEEHIGAVEKSEVKKAIEEVVAASGGYEVFPVSKMKTENPVPLMQATKLYQPVMGTSPGSRYFFVAASKDFKIAVRVKGKQMSMRFEGNLKPYKQKLMEAGLVEFKSSPNGTEYLSVHLECGDFHGATKAIGALLLGINAQMVTPMPNLSVLQGKGE